MLLNQKVDNFFSTELTNHLFQTPGQKFGLDLVALNIQRGRDHGLPGYVKYRELCGLARPKSIDDLKKVFSNEHVAEVVTQMYRSLDDIDLFVGGTSERHMDGAVVGPTFACIIGEQFRRIKRGDRFWYENADQIGSFTELQLDEIKKSTLARVLCDNSAVDYMQPQAMLMASQRYDIFFFVSILFKNLNSNFNCLLLYIEIQKLNVIVFIFHVSIYLRGLVIDDTCYHKISWYG